MGMQDRDWYREEQRQKRQQQNSHYQIAPQHQGYQQPVSRPPVIQGPPSITSGPAIKIIFFVFSLAAAAFLIGGFA